jgi:putative ABC transport system permease protein
MLRSPGTTAVCVLTLGLAIGASTAIFSVVSAVTLKPLPYEQPEKLVRMYTEFPTMGLKKFWVSPPEYFDIRREIKSFQEVGAYGLTTAGVAGLERPVRVPAAYITHTLLPILGVQPRLGRNFLTFEDLPGDPTAMIISHDLWKRAYGSDPDIIGKQTMVDAYSMTIVGVMPPGFDFPGEGVEAWFPARLNPLRQNRGNHWLSIVTRLKPGVSLEAARSEVDARVAAWAAEDAHKESHSFGPNHPLLTLSLSEEIIGPVRPALWLLQGAVLVVLLIAVANIANLLLARAEGRSREVALRATLGAPPTRLLRQFLTESVVLGLLGGGLGVLFAVWGIDLTLLLMPEGAPRMNEIKMNGGVLGFTAVVAIGSGLLFGLAPLLLIKSDRLHDALKEGGRRTSSGKHSTRLRNALVVAETAMALVLVVGCGVLLRSFVRLSQVDLGFKPQGILTFEIELPSRRYPNEGDTPRAFWLRLQERMAALPGVTGVSLASGLPPVRPINANDLALVGRTHQQGDPPWNTDYWQCVGDDFFQVMGLRLVAGRSLTPTDDEKTPLVVVINEAFARKYFPGEDPLGKQIRLAGWEDKRPPQTIVGVVADVKQGGIDKPAGTEVFFNVRQAMAITNDSYTNMAVLLKTAGDPLSLAPTVQRVMRELDPTLPIARLQTLDKVVWSAASKPRFLAFLVTVFAGLALLIAAVGVYGVMSYSVAQRTQEIGIRMALGAPPRSIRTMILARALLIAGAGCVLGIAGAIAFALGLSRALTTLLYETQPIDPMTLAVVPLVVLFIAALAAWFPARRATRVDPMTCLRSE